tara:strand:- start:335 stop:457 length:123 start_codon:yes stop_codon:yes gene_type:complete
MCVTVQNVKVGEEEKEEEAKNGEEEKEEQKRFHDHLKRIY